MFSEWRPHISFYCSRISTMGLAHAWSFNRNLASSLSWNRSQIFGPLTPANNGIPALQIMHDGTFGLAEQS